MLEQLLNEIKKEGVLQPGILAARLNLSIAMVEAMLASLESMGLVQRIDVSCSSSCKGCPMQSGCAPDNKNRLWILKHRPASPASDTAVIETT